MSDGYYYLAEDPVSLGFIVGCIGDANTKIKLFRSRETGEYEAVSNVWLQYPSRKKAMHLINQIKAKHPEVEYQDLTKKT
jgi:hypothetical protein